MKFYFSGLSARGAYPEAVISDALIMLTFWTSYAGIIEKKPVEEVTEKFPLEIRFRRVHYARIGEPVPPRKKAEKRK
jgi:hypothetical protein